MCITCGVINGLITAVPDNSEDHLGTFFEVLPAAHRGQTKSISAQN
jgi:hypothetical protein